MIEQALKGLFLNAYTSYFGLSQIQPHSLKQKTVHSKIIYLLNWLLQGLLETKTNKQKNTGPKWCHEMAKKEKKVKLLRRAQLFATP